MSRSEKGAVMRWVGVHIEAKRGRGRLRDGGASKENKCFFPVKGSRGRRVQSAYTLGEFRVPEIHERGREKSAGVFSRHGRLPRAYADQCIHAERSFFPHQKVFFSAAAEQQQTAAFPRAYADQCIHAGRSFIFGTTAAAQKREKCAQLMEAQLQLIYALLGLTAMSYGLESSGKRDKYRNDTE